MESEAHRLTERGFIVHPLTGPNAGGNSPGKRPIKKDWQKQITPYNEKVMAGWWGPTVKTKYNMGLVCGRASDVMVVDMDSMLFIDDLFDGIEIDTLRSARIKGRGHIFFKYDQGIPSQKHHDLGIEILSDGSNAVLPPSVHISGDVYHWADPNAPIQEMPAELKTRLLALFELKKRVAELIRSCRPCFRRVWKDKDDLHGSDGREMMLAFCTELKANGATLEDIRFVAKIVYQDEYDQDRTDTEFRNSDTSKPWKCATIQDKLSGFVSDEQCDRCGMGRARHEPGYNGKATDQGNRVNVDGLTDWGNAKRLVKKYGDDIRYCPEMKDWYIWNNEIWKQDTIGLINQLAKHTVLDLWSVAQNVNDLHLKEKMVKFAIVSENQNKLKNMIESAQNEPGMPIEINEFDFNKDIICAENGIVNLRTGNLSGFSKEEYTTKQMKVKYCPGAEAPRFKQFLSEIVPDPEIRAYLQRFFGYSLTGHTSEQIFCILYGHGGNGKGTLIDTIMDVMGDIAKSTDPGTIIQQQSERTSTNDLADLKGARFVVTSENKSNQVLDEGRIKRITGQDRIKCRFLYREFIEYVPEYKLALLTNHEPIIKSSDNSIWRRVHKVPFDVEIKKEDWDLQLRDKLLQEREGILAWLVDGAMMWYDGGLLAPEAIIQASQEYREELDIISDFVGLCCDVNAGSEIVNHELYTVYKHWCVMFDIRQKTSNSFSREMNERGFKSFKKNGIRFKTGLDFKEKFREEFELVKNLDDERTLARSIGSILDSLVKVPRDSIKVNSFTKKQNTDPKKSTDGVFGKINRPCTRLEEQKARRILDFIKIDWGYSTTSRDNEKTNTNNDEEYTIKLMSDELLIKCDLNGVTISKELAISLVRNILTHKENTKDQRTRIKEVHDIILSIQSGNGNRATRAAIRSAAEDIGIDDTDTILKHMASQGQVLQHEDNVFQVI